MSDYADTDARAYLPGSHPVTADEVEPEARRDERPLRSGLEREDRSETVDPATFVRESRTPALETGTRGQPSTDYRMDIGLGYLASSVHNARRRDSAHEVMPPAEVAEAWDTFVTLADAAKEAVAAIPFVMGEAQRARSEAAASASEPTVLPSVADARSWAEQRARTACHAALAARADYDRLIESSAKVWAKALSKSVPAMADAVLARVTDLQTEVERLRSGVDTLLDQSFAAAPAGMGRTRNPGKADLRGLVDLVREVEQLKAAAAKPTEPILAMSMQERERIMAFSRNAIGGMTQEMAGLAQVERGEGFAVTQYTRGYTDADIAAMTGSWI